MNATISDALPPWLASILKENGRRYNWHSAETAILKRWWGRMSRDQVARKVSRVLRVVVGDPNARRTVQACVNQAYQIGLEAYRGERDEMYLKLASIVTDLPYDTLYRATSTGDLPSVRRGKCRYVSISDWEVWLTKYRIRRQEQADTLAEVDEETISKQEAMTITGFSETHVTRLLTSGILKAWKIPDLGMIGRGEWRVSLTSVQALAERRSRCNNKRLHHGIKDDRNSC